MGLDYERLRTKLSKVRIAVVGDVCLDWYLFIDPGAAERSVETGKLTRPVEKSRYSPGGAGNVAANLASLGAGAVSIVGVVGNDPFGQTVERLLSRLGIETQGLLRQNERWHTSVYTKIHENGEEDRRIDFGNFNSLAERTESLLFDALEAELDRAHVLIVNQQLTHGIHTDSFRAALCSRIAAHPDIPVLVDSRDYAEAYDGTVRKLNVAEAARCCGAAPPDGAGLSEARRFAETLAAAWRTPVVVSRGEYGCLIADTAGVRDAPGIALAGGKDIVGAGDALLAGIACGIGCGEELDAAVHLGNLVAAVTVGKALQTGTATLAEVEKLAEEATFRYRPELALGIETPRYFDDGEIEIVTRRPGEAVGRAVRVEASTREARFDCAVFDHDGTISTLRQGWETVMAPMMIEAICPLPPGEGDPALIERVRARVMEYIEATTGIQTIAQMAGLAELVREFGIAREILDPVAYKSIYNRKLMHTVRRRTEKFRRGELSTLDVTLKGAVEFLQRLADRDVRLYLASGTDQTDVEEEATLLGYADLFSGGIYGATDSIDDEPKKRALRAILDDIGATSSVVTFGDGPVEMRETVARGGYAVGVASDEIRRYGLNPDKRRRLIFAGADLIVPDFSRSDHLMRLLFGEGS